MKHTQIITIEVNGKTIQATVQLDAPDLETEDCLNAQVNHPGLKAEACGASASQV